MNTGIVVGLAILAIGGLAISRSRESQSFYTSNSLFVAVFSESPWGQPIAGATVTVNGKSAVTNASGAITFTYLTPGEYNIMVGKEGFTMVSYTGIIYVGDNYYSAYLAPI